MSLISVSWVTKLQPLFGGVPYRSILSPWPTTIAVIELGTKNKISQWTDFSRNVSTD